MILLRHCINGFLGMHGYYILPIPKTTVPIPIFFSFINIKGKKGCLGVATNFKGGVAKEYMSFYDFCVIAV